MPMDFFVWIVSNKFRTILVDSGFGARAAAAKGRALDIDPIDAIAKLGIDPDKIEDVIITHLHFDHAGNMDRFGRARFHVQDAEAAYATGPCMCEPFARAPFDVEDVVTFVRRLYADRVVFHNGEASPFPGISVHALPGHSAGIQAVRVMTPRGPVLLASDVSHYYANFLRRLPFRLTIDVGATQRSHAQLVKIAGSVDRIIPGHDPRVRSLYRNYVVNGVEVIALHEPPRPHTLDELMRLSGD
jgi:glyoxylase-like metal-dependent hydrolase (beta-lactamase superfamily II)